MALGGVLKIPDVRMLAVALEGIENTFKCGEKHYKDENGINMFTTLFEQLGLLDDLENLQTHTNHNIYTQSLKIIENYFSAEGDEDPLMNAIDQNLANGHTQNPTVGGGLFEL